MDFIKKHKYKAFGLFVFLILMFLAFIGLRELIYPDDNKNRYGNRLDGIENVRINNDKLEAARQELLKIDYVAKVKNQIQGRIINFIIEVKPNTDLVSSKSLADKLLEKFSKEEKDYYDFQVFLVTSDDAESELYPIVGYKHKTSLVFKWIRNS
jgi:preprotein translocase subunit SecF